jgi:hypothetical protein
MQLVSNGGICFTILSKTRLVEPISSDTPPQDSQVDWKDSSLCFNGCWVVPLLGLLAWRWCDANWAADQWYPTSRSLATSTLWPGTRELKLCQKQLRTTETPTLPKYDNYDLCDITVQRIVHICAYMCIYVHICAYLYSCIDVFVSDFTYFDHIQITAPTIVHPICVEIHKYRICQRQDLLTSTAKSCPEQNSCTKSLRTR